MQHQHFWQWTTTTVSIHWSKMKNDQKRKYSRSHRWWKPFFDGMKTPLKAQTACCDYSKVKANGPSEGRKMFLWAQTEIAIHAMFSTSVGKEFTPYPLVPFKYISKWHFWFASIWKHSMLALTQVWEIIEWLWLFVTSPNFTDISHFLEMSRADTSLFRSGLPFRTRCSSEVSLSFFFCRIWVTPVKKNVTFDSRWSASLKGGEVVKVGLFEISQVCTQPIATDRCTTHIGI